MERCLSLVLDKEGRISLTLEKMEARKLDEYISKNFNSSEDIRKKYSKRIKEYLDSYSGFIQEVEENNNKRYAGSIVITELQDNLTYKRKRVLYKRDMILFKEICKNKRFILNLENRDYINYRRSLDNKTPYDSLFSEQIGYELKFRVTNDDRFNRVVTRWRSSIKDLNRYYDIIRTVLKEYEKRYKELNLDSPDVLYSKYLKQKSKNYSQRDEKFEESLYRYRTLADEEDYPGDLENHYSGEDIIKCEQKVMVKSPWSRSAKKH